MPSTAASNYFSNPVHESSVRLAKHPGMNPIRQNTDRVRINKGGSAMSHKSSHVVNQMAVQPFSRTGFGHALMEGMIRTHKLNFNYAPNAPLGPSDFAMSQFRQQELTAREEAVKHTTTGNKLYNGTSCFANTFFSDARENKQRMLQKSTQMAKMRFMQQVDISNKIANAKQEEIDNATADFDRKMEKEDNWRKGQLFNMADSNLKMHSDL